MGVSESSLKRWCDRGVIQVHRTAGGHRKIPVASVVRFVRGNQRELVRPEIIGLPGRPDDSLGTFANAVSPLVTSLTAGDMDTCQQIAFSFYLQGRTVAEICDDLFTPALARIGDQWNHGDIEIFEEHRAFEMLVKMLHEFRGAIDNPRKSAPLAMGGTADGDRYAMPTQMIELALLETGWQATSLGTSLPFPTLLSAIQQNRPRLFWLSVSAVADASMFLQELNHFSEVASRRTSVFVGGRALTPDLRKSIRFAVCCDNVQQLVAHAQRLSDEHE